MSNVYNLFTGKLLEPTATQEYGVPGLNAYGKKEVVINALKPARQRTMPKVHGFTYARTKNVYRIANCFFDANNIQAYSYGWWRFVEAINGAVVFNNFAYSNTTRRHQQHMLSLLRELGIKIDATIHAPGGLQDLNSAIKHYRDLIANLQAQIDKPKSKRSKNAERRSLIDKHEYKIKVVNRLIKAKTSAA